MVRRGTRFKALHQRWRARGLLVASILAAIAGVPSSEVLAAGPPSSPQVGHAYRHGLVHMRGHEASATASNANDLNFGGGIDGVGVTTGRPGVFLVFWGSQWGTQSTNSSGYTTFSGDKQGVAPDLQAFFKGLGTAGETWSGVMTQYCEGVPAGSQSCPTSNNTHIGYPLGGALAGVWEDTSAAAPQAATSHEIAQEAANAATHFGNTTSASDRNVQYVIVSPTGTDPDSYQTGGFCAWHDYTGDTSLDGGGAVGGTAVAFTNLPYIPDAGSGCGLGFVNGGSGVLDGVTIVEGHEYAETLTDQFPAGGWVDSIGAENGDKCAWIASGQGAAQNISLTTGSFAVQTTWANDYNDGAGGCEISHSIVTNPNSVTVTNPGVQSSKVGQALTLQISASDSASGQSLAYGAVGLPPGLSIASGSGLISGTPTTAGTSSVTVTATDTTGASGNTAFTWTVTNTVAVTNPGAQSSKVGQAVSLQISASDSTSGQSLTYSAAGLPPGLSIASASGLVSGTPTAAGSSTVMVTATDTTGAAGSTSFVWTVTNAADLALTNAAPARVPSGDRLTYTVTVTNTGGETANNVSASEVLPASVHFDSAVPTQGTCTRSPEDESKSKKAGTITCQIGTLGAGSSAKIVVVALATRPEVLVATATASASNVAFDVDDSAIATTSVQGT